MTLTPIRNYLALTLRNSPRRSPIQFGSLGKGACASTLSLLESFVYVTTVSGTSPLYARLGVKIRAWKRMNGTIQ